MRSIFWANPEWVDLLMYKPLFGGEEGDGEGEGEEVEVDDSDESEDLDEDQTDDADDSDDSDDSDESEDDDEDIKVSLKQLKKENRKLKRDLEEAMEILEESEEKSQHADEDEERTAELVSLREENEALTSLLNGQYVKNAISTFKYDWVDTDDVFNALDADDLDIDIETGNIDGLEDQLADIASRKPHWLKKKERKPREESSTGAPPANSGRRTGKGKSRAEYAAENPGAYSILTR